MSDIKISKQSTQQIDVVAGTILQPKTVPVLLTSSIGGIVLNPFETFVVKDDSTISISNMSFKTAVIASEVLANTVVVPAIPVTAATFGNKPTEPVIVGVTYDALSVNIVPTDATKYTTSITSTASIQLNADKSFRALNTTAGNISLVVTNKDGSTVGDVYNITAQNLAVTFPTIPNGNIGTTYQIVSTVTPSGLSGLTYEYTSSDPTVASVSNSGLITFVAVGTVTITVTVAYRGVQASYSASVSAISVPTEEIVDLSTVALDPRVTLTSVSRNRLFWNGVDDKLIQADATHYTDRNKQYIYPSLFGRYKRTNTSINLVDLFTDVGDESTGTAKWLTNSLSDITFESIADHMGNVRQVMVLPADWKYYSTWSVTNSTWLIENTLPDYTEQQTQSWFKEHANLAYSNVIDQGAKYYYLGNADRSKYIVCKTVGTTSFSSSMNILYKAHSDSTKRYVAYAQIHATNTRYAYPTTNTSNNSENLTIATNSLWNRVELTTVAGITTSATISIKTYTPPSLSNDVSLYSTLRFYNQ